VRNILAGLAILAAGLALIYWGWQPRGREEGLALGLFLVIVAVPLLLYAFNRARR
jgi:hypothetical protein